MSHDPLADLGHARFVLLTTYRSSGQAVATPVWVVRDSDRLAVLTNLDSGKVRRLRRDPAVTLQPCTPRGDPLGSSRPVRGRAEVVAEPDTVGRVWRLVRRKYAIEHAVLRVLGLVRPSWRRWHGAQAVLHLALPDPVTRQPSTVATDPARAAGSPVRRSDGKLQRTLHGSGNAPRATPI